MKSRGAVILSLVRVAPDHAVERGDGPVAPRGSVRSPPGAYPGRGLLRASAEDAKLCALAAVGVDEHGAERLLAVEDGALGFWAAPDQAYPHTRHRRCRLRKTGSILNVRPKSV